MNTKYELKIVHMYPENLNLYGDIGNIIVLRKRCKWRGIGTAYQRMDLKDRVPTDGDIYFIGGGQDKDEYDVYKDLVKHKKKIEEIVESGAVFLCVCAGFQLFGNYFISGEGKRIKGLGIIDAYTQSPGDRVSMRCIGNVVTKINSEAIYTKDLAVDTMVGFENHIGQTYIGKGVQPLGIVNRGKGNNAREKVEGAVYKNVICSYLHGPVLTKNPHIADVLIKRALRRKYKRDISLKKLNDKEELEAHKYVIENI